MTKLTLPRPTPFFTGVSREMDEVQNRLRRFFANGFGLEGFPLSEPVGWVPTVEIIENEDALILTAELPGLTKENVEITFENDRLTIRGEKLEEKKEGNGEKRYHLWERAYGAFQRTFMLPRTVDFANIAADFKDGVLTVRMPKTALAKAKGRKIDIASK